MRTFAKSPLFYLARRMKGHGTSPDGLPLRVTRMVAPGVVALDARDVHGVGACRLGTSATYEVVTRDIRGVKGQEGVLHGAELPVSRTLITIVIATLAAMAVGVAPALAAEPCPNEAIRAESNTNPATGQPYDLGLPECRAYEMVSPLEKQAHAVAMDANLSAAAPDGSAADFISQGGFSDPQDFEAVVGNPYLAQRSGLSWLTASAFAPASLIAHPNSTSGAYDFTSDLAEEAVCGNGGETDVLAHEDSVGGIVCAIHEANGTWTASPEYTNLLPELPQINEYLGSSSDLSRLVFQVANAGTHLLSSDTFSCSSCFAGSIYEIVGLGGPSPVLNLVNVDNSGAIIGPEHPTALGGAFGINNVEKNDDYQAVSTDGDRIFFTATPTKGVPTIYARVEPSLGHYETVEVSRPSQTECPDCSAIGAGAEYQGASADGSKVFFTTSEALLPSDTDSSNDLYMYDFSDLGRHLSQISGGGAGDLTPGNGAEVQGIVNISSDGSHVYFVAHGVLTTVPNGRGDGAIAGADNLYMHDTENDQTRFVADLCSSAGTSATVADPQCPETLTGKDDSLWDSRAALAQTTPDGQFLVFDSYAQLITYGPEADTDASNDVYRYDADTGELVRVSIGEPAFPASANGNGEGYGAVILTPNNADQPVGANSDLSDLSRSVSNSGETIIFVTSEELQSDDVNGEGPSNCEEGTAPTGCDLYQWHNGVVSLISDGQSPAGTTETLASLAGSGAASMSATGSDIFFTTRTQLVRQDIDELGDVYDARINGGFPAPMSEPSCAGEACQGSPSTSPLGLKPEGSSTQLANGNLIPPPFTESPEDESNNTGAVKINSHSSNALTASTPGTGTLTLSGSGWVTQKATATKAGVYSLALSLTPLARKELARHGKVTLTVRVVFVSTSGKSSTASTRVTIKQPSTKTKPKAKSKPKKKKK